MNVLVIMFDSLRPDHLGANGHPYVKTPNLDKLANESALFSNFVVEFPITIPSRTALITGNYTFTNRPWMPLRDTDVTIAQRLTEAGYHTCCFTDSPFNKGPKMDRGFCEFYWLPGGKCAPCVNPDRKIDMSGITFSPEQSQIDIDLCRQTLSNRAELTEREGMYFPDITTRAAIDWLENWKGGPFFLWLDYFEPHEPWEPPRPYCDLYDPDYKGRFIPMPSMSPHYLSDEELRHVIALYDGCITQADEQLGKLRAALERLNLWDDTLVVVLSDHGEPFGEHGTIRKFDVPVYDELTKALLIWRDPLEPEGRRVEALVQNVDFAPTLLDRLGIEAHKMNGVSVKPILDGKVNEVREVAHSGAFQVRASVRDKEWKLIDNRGQKELELFNLVDDPMELNNLASKEPERVRKMHRQIWEFGLEWSEILAWRKPASQNY